jgi:cytochrome c-type biogenesis protein CcsB
MLFTVWLYYRKKTLRGLALVTVPGTLLLLGYGIMRDPMVLAVSASFKSNWLIIHVLFAQLSYGAYAVASGFGGVYLLKERRERAKKPQPSLLDRVPSLPLIEEYLFKFIVYGFIADAVMIAAGAIWAKELWGAYWGWDPVEVWSLVSWLVYGLAIHLRVTMGWRGRRLAWIAVFAIVTVLITYWGVDLVVQGSHRMFGVTRQ